MQITSLKLRKKISSVARRLGLRPPSENAKLKVFHHADPGSLSSAEVLAFMRHDAHRIEKSFYNKIFEAKQEFYTQRRDNVLRAIDTLLSRGIPPDEPTLVWAKEIAEKFDRLPAEFIAPKSTPAKPFNGEAAGRFLELVATRRSSRVWSDTQPSEDSLQGFARHMVDAGRWAPTSGDRQPVRFKILTDSSQKYLLKGLKEEHCYNAPCLIFIGVDRRLYGGLGENEAAMYVDAGAAGMQMVLLAHSASYGVCWNHFSRDLIASRASNEKVFRNFAQAVNIPDYVEPVGIIAFGVAAYYPPTPARMNVSDYLL